jgi:hypothetical protein
VGIGSNPIAPTSIEVPPHSDSLNSASGWGFRQQAPSCREAAHSCLLIAFTSNPIAPTIFRKFLYSELGSSTSHRRAALNWASRQWVAPDAAFIEAHEADLITHSADPNHAKARFSAAVVQFHNRSALNDRRGVFQSCATAADVVSENRLLKAMTGIVNSG